MPDNLLPCPGILRRLLGMGYELLLMLALLAVAVLLPHLLIAATTHYLATPLVLWAHLFATLLAYFVWFWSHGRQTLPMKTWRMRLVTRDGSLTAASPGAVALPLVLAFDPARGDWPDLGLDRS